MIKIKNSKIDRLIEAAGLRYFQRLSSKMQSEKCFKLDGVPSDNTLREVSGHIVLTSVMIAFAVGALTTVPAVIFTIYCKGDYSQEYLYYLILSAITLLMLVVEVGVLYWVSLKGVHVLSVLMDKEEHIDETLPLVYDVRAMMVRAALELDDPAVEYLGVDPQKYVSRQWIVLSALLYKAKIVLTSVVLRVLLQKISLRLGFRVGFAWVAIPVTAVWDAVVMYKVFKDAKVRLYGYYISAYISQKIITPDVLKNYAENSTQGCMRALSSLMVLSKNYHPNTMMLLIRLNETLKAEISQDYDDLERYLQLLENSHEKRETSLSHPLKHRSRL